MAARTFDDLLGRIRSEYVEMPGLWLTTEQAVRLWGLEREQCEQLLNALVALGFLVMRPDGKFGRASEGNFDPGREVMRPPLDADPATSPPNTRRLP